MSGIFRQLRGVIVFAGFAVNTVFWFVPLFLLAVVKLLIPIAGVRAALTRVLMAIGESWISVNAVLLNAGGSIDWRISASPSCWPEVTPDPAASGCART